MNRVQLTLTFETDNDQRPEIWWVESVRNVEKALRDVYTQYSVQNLNMEMKYISPPDPLAKFRDIACSLQAGESVVALREKLFEAIAEAEKMTND